MLERLYRKIFLINGCVLCLVSSPHFLHACWGWFGDSKLNSWLWVVSQEKLSPVFRLRNMDYICSIKTHLYHHCWPLIKSSLAPKCTHSLYTCFLLVPSILRLPNSVLSHQHLETKTFSSTNIHFTKQPPWMYPSFLFSRHGHLLACLLWEMLTHYGNWVHLTCRLD